MYNEPHKDMLTQQRAKELFDCKKSDGLLIRKYRRGRAPAGTHSTSLDRDGYLVVGIDGRIYRAHRVVWLYFTGSWPTGDIDHINRIKTDNRFANLRDVSRSENKQNQLASKSNKLGVKGVFLQKSINRYVAAICVHGKNIHLGCFGTPEEAAECYAAGAAKYHTNNPLAKG